MGLAGQAVKNAAFNVAAWVFPFGISIVILPYIVTRLGVDAYGVLTLITTVIGYFGFLDLGLGNAVIKYVAEYQSKGDQNTTNQVISLTVMIFFLLGCLGGGIIVLLAKPLAFRFLKIPTSLQQIAYWAFCLGAPGFLFTLFVNLPESVLRGLNRFDLTSSVSVLMGTSTTLLTALLIYLGYGLIHIVVLNICIPIIELALYWSLSKKLMPRLRLTKTFPRPVFSKVMSFGAFSLMSRLSYFLSYRTDRILIGILLGTAWVTYFVVPFALISRLATVMVKISNVLFPAISELQGRGDYESIKDFYLTSSRLVLILATAICLPLFLFGRQFLAVWMGAEFARQAEGIMPLVAIGFYLSAMTNVPTTVANGLGKPQSTGVASLVTSVIYLGLLVLLSRLAGVRGVAIAFVCGNLIVTPCFIYYVTRKVLRISIAGFIRDVFVRPVLAALFLVMAAAWFPIDRFDNLVVVLLLMAMAGLLYLVLAFLTGAFEDQEKRVVYDVLRERFRRLGWAHSDER